MTSSERRGVVAAAACLTALFVAPGARADAAADSRAAFTEGRELVQAGKCAEAVPHFRRALELLPSGLGALRNVANCEEQIGRFVAARRDLQELRRSLASTHDAKYAGWDADAADAIVRVEAKIARLVVRVGPAPAAAPARVTVDGEPVDDAALSGGLERDPGAHVVEAHAGAAVARASVTLQPGERRELALAFPGPSTPPPPKPLPARPRTAFWLGVAGLGLGGAALAGAGVAAAIHADAISTIEARCPMHVGCDPSLRAVHDRAATTGPLAVGLGVGGAVLAVGGGLALWIAPRRPASVAVGGRF